MGRVSRRPVEQLDGTALEKHRHSTDTSSASPSIFPTQGRRGRRRSFSQWQKWRNKWLAHAATLGRGLSVELWSRSALSERLSRDDPASGGRLLYWFDEETLSQAWFRAKFAKSRAGLGSRYTPETNVRCQSGAISWRSFATLSSPLKLRLELPLAGKDISLCQRSVRQLRVEAIPTPRRLKPQSRGLCNNSRPRA